MPQQQRDPSSQAGTRLGQSGGVSESAGRPQPSLPRPFRDDPPGVSATQERALPTGRSHRNATRLKGGSVGVVAVVLLFPEALQRPVPKPFYFDILRAVETAAAQRGIAILLSGQSQSSSFRSDFEERRQADGIIVIGTPANRNGWEFFARARRDGANVIAWGAPELCLPTLRGNDWRMGQLAAAHLIEAGCRRPAFAGPRCNEDAALSLRRAGFLAELERHGPIGFSADLSLSSINPCEESDDWAETMLVREDGPDGVFAASEGLGAKIVRALSRSGRRIPEDMAVVGFENGQGAQISTPALTTIEQDTTKLGELLVEAVLNRIGTDTCLGEVPVKLAVRESSRRRT